MNLPKIDTPLAVFWMRRDLRLEDNRGLNAALQSGLPVLLLFIFDDNILSAFNNKNDIRVNFIHQQLEQLDKKLAQNGSSLCVLRGRPVDVWEQLCDNLPIKAVYLNRDYEPYARERDSAIENLLKKRDIQLYSFKDQLIFEPTEILKDDGSPYTVYTPFRNRWMKTIYQNSFENYPSEIFLKNLVPHSSRIPTLEDLGFTASDVIFPPAEFPFDIIRHYDKTRDFPAISGVSRIGVHFRFGTLSIRKAVRTALDLNETWLNELIWREFFMMVLYYFPHTVDKPYREKYARLIWRRDRSDFERWKNGQTGFPIVDAGMKELSQSGYMHNRVRMITANFLTKLLRIDWRLGERWFAEKLLDFELSSNVGNWQWSAGCGCDAAPYFRIFNPDTQQQKFDADFEYIKQWLPKWGSQNYPKPMIDYKAQRQISLEWFKNKLNTA